MAVTSTPAYPQSGDTETAQLTSANGTTETGNLFSGTTNGKLIREIRITSGAMGPRQGSSLLLLLYNGSDSRILETIRLQGGAYQRQATLYFSNLFLPSGKSIRAKMDETLDSACQLDIVCMSEVF